MRPVLLAVVLALVAACGGSDASTTTAVVLVPVAAIIPNDPDLRSAIYSVGINGVGTLNAPEEEWVALAEAGCQEGAWEWGVARALGEQFLVSNDPEDTTDGATMAQTVWLMTILGCRDRFPLGAIDRGPPPPLGP